jgi:glycosyltransferase involved in cell wall biosynthesis
MFPVNYLGVGGAEQQLKELVTGIDKTRFAPIVVTLYPGGVLEPELKMMPGVELVCLNRHGKYDPATLYKMSYLLHEKQVQIIQPFLTPATFFGILPSLARPNIIKIVTERCGVRVNPRWGSSIYRKVEDILTHFADWVVPNSRSGADYLIQRGINPAKVKVVYNGINLKRLNPDLTMVKSIRAKTGVPPDGKVIGITASLTPAKDHNTFLQAARLISQSFPETRFAILGDGPLRPEMEELTKQLGIEGKVTFFGNQRDIGSYLSAYDIACLTSFDHEGCSNAALEAMALDKPVVVTDVGGNREIIEHGKTGFLVPPKDPQAFADAVINCLRNPELTRIIGEQAGTAIRTQFSLEHMVQEYQNLYERALNLKHKLDDNSLVTKSYVKIH